MTVGRLMKKNFNDNNSDEFGAEKATQIYLNSHY